MSTDTAVNLKLRVFISSVQKELEEERMQLRILLTSDPFLLRYTVPKLFEKYPAPLRPDKKAYLKLLEKCQLYVLLIGKEYGSDSGGKSATHHEYDFAQEHRLPTLVCVKGDSGFKRNDAEAEFFEHVKADGHTYSRFKAPASAAADLPKSVVEELNKRQRAILELAVSTGSVTNRQVQEKFRVVRDTAHRDLVILCELGLLQQQGKGRATLYTPTSRES